MQKQGIGCKKSFSDEILSVIVIFVRPDGLRVRRRRTDSLKASDSEFSYGKRKASR